MAIFWGLFLCLGAYPKSVSYLESMTPNWTPPEKRNGSSLYTLDDILIVFGGKGFEKKYNDFWFAYHKDAGWERTEIPTGNALSNTYSGPRSEALLFHSGENPEFIFLFGGKDEYGFVTDIWSYHITLRVLEKILEFKEISGLSDFASCTSQNYTNNLLFIYGGRTFSNPSSDIWVIDVIEKTINKYPQNEYPQRVALNSKIFYYNSELYQIWGTNEEEEIDPNIYKYNFTSLTWTKLNVDLGEFSPSLEPEIFIYNDFLFVYGGLNSGKKIYNRILRADLLLDPLKFEEVNISNYQVKYKPGITFDGEYFWLFGGKIDDNTNQLDYANINIIENTFNSTQFTYDFTYPEERIFSTLHLIDNKFAMFGGHNGAKYYNDLWLFDMIEGKWSPGENKGKVPSVRTSHAAGSQGDTLIVWGGEDANGYRNDIFLYNFITSIWHEIHPKNEAPSSRIGACGILIFPKFYILGGQTYVEVLNEIWEYDFNTKLYTKLPPYTESFYGGHCQLFKNKIYILGAKDKNYLGFPSIPFYDISTQLWDTRFYRSKSPYYCEGISILLSGNLLEYGGQLRNDRSIAKLFIYNDIKLVYQSPWLIWHVFAAGYTYSKSKLIFYGGGISEYFITPSHQRASNRFTYLHIEQIAKNLSLPLYCSEGSYLLSDYICEFCPQGSYASEIGENNCTLCPQGTFNSINGSTSKRQCYPCAEGFFNMYEGRKSCFPCPENYYCPIGSVEPEKAKPNFTEISIQPKSYQVPGYYSKIYYLFLLYATCSFVALLLVLLIVPFLRRKISIVDIFSNLHKRKVNLPLVFQKNAIGGFYTLSFFIFALVFFGLNAIQFFLLNITETKTLQPISVFQKDVGKFSTDFNISVTFHYYGGNCYNDTLNSINIETIGIIGNNIDVIIEKNDRDCKLSFYCKDCSISSQNKVTFKSVEENCFTKAISLDISSVSSVPESLSIMGKTIEAETNKIFIGETPSEFSYSFTPSIFYSSLSAFPSSGSGYFLSEYSPPITGSTFQIEELAEVSGLSVLLHINQRNFGLFIERKENQGLLIIISAFTGLLSGTFSIVGVLVFITDKTYDSVIEKNHEKQKFKLILIKRLNLSFFSDLKEHIRPNFQERQNSFSFRFSFKK
ncbi:hypothetical protein SteCoe_1893 [Stentor coeruleus]|uniref:Tyrosine-protein kinase ephrin type A/B receptor-like domain-containing protein n=1 Tax=Stentor coeruleus TaxID=5963 RepID=A0A1R2D0U4_9CILI|nr:hypothetical protein SteCoe_1893 [Stentor coeruleus]